MSEHAHVLALLLIFVCCVNAKYKNYGLILESTDYKEMSSLFDPENMLKNYNSTLALHEFDEIRLSSSCGRDLLTLEEAIVRRKTWALTMLDASSKPVPSGLLRGNLVDLGHYDECSAVRSSESSVKSIRGLHCTYSISVGHEDIRLPVDLTMSICLPSTCSANDVLTYFNGTTFSRIEWLEDLQIKFVKAACSPADRPVWDLEFVLWLSFLGVLVIFLIACTVVEIKLKPSHDSHRGHSFADTLAMFSLRKSAASVLSMKVKKGTLPAIDGIGCISMWWIVLFHQYTHLPEGAIINIFDYFEWQESWNSLYIYVATFAVDTFFTISGFLMTYLFLKEMPKQKKFNVLTYYLHRYLRLTPSILAMLIFAIVFIPKLGSGPRWDIVLNSYVNSCQTKWWPALVYLQNFFDKDNMCMQHTWYLAVNMQLFWISPLILYPLYKKPNCGLVIIGALLLSSLVISASIIRIQEIHAMAAIYANDTIIGKRSFNEVYSVPYHRAGPWFVGIFLGHEVATRQRQLSKWSSAAGWFITIASFAFCTFGMRSFIDPGYEYNAVWDILFWVFSHPVWALGICWIIYASTKNEGGFLSNILSFRIFLPLSRLSYGVYIIHFMLISIDNAALKIPWLFTESNLWRSFFNTLMFSTGFAFLIHIFFESPIMVLEKILRSKPTIQFQKSHAKNSQPAGGEILATEALMNDHSVIKTNGNTLELELFNVSQS